MKSAKPELVCSKCRQKVSYRISKREAKTVIKDLEIDYEEFYGICAKCGSEIYVPGLDDKNEEEVELLYRKKKGLITIPEIYAILDKYHIEKRPLSKLLGFGELTITRYLDGQLPSPKYSDLLLQVLNDEQKMKMFAEKNRQTVSDATGTKIFDAIKRCEKEKEFHSSAERIAIYIICSGEEITNLLLQKLLYYVKAIGNLFFENSIIPEVCEAWRFGPVFPEVYEKYKEFGKEEITLNVSTDYLEALLTEEEKKLVDFVLNTFGIYNAWFLKDLTHLEEPWVDARKGLSAQDSSRNTMNDQLIQNYFRKMDKIYHLKSPEGIARYISDMRKRM